MARKPSDSRKPKLVEPSKDSSGRTQRRKPETGELRRLKIEAGEWIRELRLGRDLTQLELSRLLGHKYYTFISQVEGGVGRVPPEEIRTWAKALRVDPTWFGRRLLRYYQPHFFDVCFPDGLKDHD